MTPKMTCQCQDKREDLAAKACGCSEGCACGDNCQCGEACACGRPAERQ